MFPKRIKLKPIDRQTFKNCKNSETRILLLALLVFHVFGWCLFLRVLIISESNSPSIMYSNFLSINNKSIAFCCLFFVTFDSKQLQSPTLPFLSTFSRNSLHLSKVFTPPHHSLSTNGTWELFQQSTQYGLFLLFVTQKQSR